MLRTATTKLWFRASKSGPGGPPGVHSASALGPQKNAELHIHNVGINNKCYKLIYNVIVVALFVYSDC